MKNDPLISIIIPSYNSQNNIKRCVNALVNQKTEISYQIIVVDCSEHELVKEICGQYQSVIYHHVPERFNPGIGRNIGAQKANGKILVFIDSDVVIDEHALENINRNYKEGCTIFGGALERFSGDPFSFASAFEHQFFNHESQKGRKKFERKNLSSAFLIVSKDVFDESGGFKDIPRMQDTELTERLIQNGHKLYFIPDVIGYQIQDSKFIQVLRKIYISGRNVYIIRYKNRGNLFKFFLFLLLPLISFLKASRICIRNIRYLAIREKGLALVISPLILIGGIIWMIGFYHSMTFRSYMTKSR